mgnify:CR=1 FL=1
MNDVNDKLIEGLEEAKKRIADLKDNVVEKTDKVAKLENELKEKDLIIHAIKTDQVKYKVDIVNGIGCDKPTKQIKIGDWCYAFIKDIAGFALWIYNEDNEWGEVSDLTEIKVWEYQEIKSFAIAVGMIKEDEDLFI